MNEAVIRSENYLEGYRLTTTAGGLQIDTIRANLRPIRLVHPYGRIGAGERAQPRPLHRAGRDLEWSTRLPRDQSHLATRPGAWAWPSVCLGVVHHLGGCDPAELNP